MKVLIISHNPIDTFQSMGKTFLSLFSEFDREELCQFYIYPSYPDIDVCSSYYRVTDKEILKSLFNFKKPGKEINKKFIKKNQEAYEYAKDEKLYRNRKNKSSVRRLLRDLIWKVARWENKGLEEWLEKENPSVIFVAPGVAKFIYDIALSISMKRNIPIVVYVCDEYYFVKPRKALIDKYQLKRLQRKIEKLMEASSHVITICDELNELYSNKFAIKATTIMTGSDFEGKETVIINKEVPKSISYFGNIRCNRFYSLREIGEVLDEVNQEKGCNCKLKIFTPEKDEEILATFDNVKSIELCGFVKGEDFKRAITESDFLLHTEAFDEASIDFVRHSISTKIADSLAVGVPMIAYGPEEISSIKYLKKNNCAYVASSRDELKSICLKCFCDNNKSEYYLKRALMIANQNHSREKNSVLLHKVLIETTN